jgi:hypothetical protein
VKQLHIILLVISLACMVLFLLLLYRPYTKRLHRDSKAGAGLLSQLPSEVDLEGHVKSVVLGIVKTKDGNRSMMDLTSNPGESQGFGVGGGLGGGLVPGGVRSGMMMMPGGSQMGQYSQFGGGMGMAGAGVLAAAGLVVTRRQLQVRLVVMVHHMVLATACSRGQAAANGHLPVACM